MIMMMVTYKMDTDREAFMKRMYDEGLVEAFRNEPGNLGYDYYLPKEQPDTILLIEKWVDIAAQQVHQNNDAVKKAGAIKNEFGIATTYVRLQTEEV